MVEIVFYNYRNRLYLSTAATLQGTPARNAREKLIIADNQSKWISHLLLTAITDVQLAVVPEPLLPLRCGENRKRWEQAELAVVAVWDQFVVGLYTIGITLFIYKFMQWWGVKL